VDHLVELCREGRIAGVGMGAGPDHVRAALGEPDDESAARDPHVLVYGAVELSLVDGVLELITFGLGRPFGDVPPARAGGVPRRWSDLDREGVLAALRERGVELTPHPHPVDGMRDYRAATVLGDVVNVTFDGDRLSGVACARGERSEPRILYLPAPRPADRA
jgi:hypothetical protein